MVGSAFSQKQKRKTKKAINQYETKHNTMKAYGNVEKGDVSKLLELDAPKPKVGAKGKTKATTILMGIVHETDFCYLTTHCLGQN